MVETSTITKPEHSNNNMILTAISISLLSNNGKFSYQQTREMFSKVSQYQAKRFLDKEWDEQKELRKYITSLNIDWSTGWLMIDDTVIEKVNVTKHCNRYYVTNMTENRITSQQIVNEYRVRWKIEVLFRNLKQLCHLEECQSKRTITQRHYVYVCMRALDSVYTS